jgi:carotenoid cleavage dioxygenase
LIRLERFDAPYASMVHDFIVTDRYVVFPIMPLTASSERRQSGGSPYLWDPDYGTHIGVMRRDEGIASLRWVRGDTGFVFHVMNAFEHCATLMADVVEYESPALFPRAKGHMVTDPYGGRLTRWTIPLEGATDTFRAEPLDDIRGEFPRIDDRQAGVSHRHGWMAGSTDGRTLNSIVHRDGASRRVQRWSVLDGDAMSEPVFVPRSDVEGDGWLLAVAWRAREEASDLVVLEAHDVARGPVATVRLPQRVPFGFHGNWLAAVR